MKGTTDKPWMAEEKSCCSCGPGQRKPELHYALHWVFLSQLKSFSNNYVKELIELEMTLGSFACVHLNSAKFTAYFGFVLLCFVLNFNLAVGRPAFLDHHVFRPNWKSPKVLCFSDQREVDPNTKMFKSLVERSEECLIFQE